MKVTAKNVSIAILMGCMALTLMIFLYLKPEAEPDIPYAEFRQALQEGVVQSVILDGQDIQGTRSDGSGFTTFNPEDAHLIDELVAHHVSFRGERPKKSIFWLGVISKILMFGIMIYLMRGALGPVMGFGRAKPRILADTDAHVTFVDVAGCDEARDDVQELVDFLKAPEAFQRLGGKMPRGVLMLGPPGTGKTLLARAIAGEAKVPFFSMAGSDFVETYIGLGASRVRQLFDAARKKAPCIIFIDEIDSVGRQRATGQSDGGHQEREQTLNQLLVEMDGFSGNEGIIVIAATNRSEVLDPALLRPGRFDRRVIVGLPDVRGRQEILEVHLRKSPCGPCVLPDVIARGTPGFSGADLANLVNEAAILAARAQRDAVEMVDFDRARDKILMGSERRSSLMSGEERRVTAYHEAGHALVGLLVPAHDPVYKVSIIPRGQALGVTQFLPEGDSFSASREKLESQISTLYGGRIAEAIVFGPSKVTTGGQNDIERATQIARMMVTRWGFSEKVGPLSYSFVHGGATHGSASDASSEQSGDAGHLIDAEVRALITTNYERAERLISDNLDKLHLMAEALIRQEKLDRSQIEEIMEIRGPGIGQGISPLHS